MDKILTFTDRQMHVYSMGAGEKTIVLLPGLGIPLPSAGFAPLMTQKFQKNIMSELGGMQNLKFLMAHTSFIKTMLT